MADQQWEYARLYLYGAKERGAGLLGGQKGWSYDCEIVYFSPGGGVFPRTLGNRDQIQAQNPFYIAMGRLGSAHWELVSVQHANGDNVRTWYSEGWGTGTIMWNQVVAYFKRPVIAGRAVDEPKIEL